MRYNPSVVPDPIAWLDADEMGRIDAVQAFHMRTKDRAENPRLHAIIHLVVENQVAEGVESTKSAINRLCREGLGRHDAIHAIGSVVAEEMFNVVRSKSQHDPAALARKLDALSASAWRK